MFIGIFLSYNTFIGIVATLHFNILLYSMTDVLFCISYSIIFRNLLYDSWAWYLYNYYDFVYHLCYWIWVINLFGIPSCAVDLIEFIVIDAHLYFMHLPYLRWHMFALVELLDRQTTWMTFIQDNIKIASVSPLHLYPSSRHYQYHPLYSSVDSFTHLTELSFWRPRCIDKQ